MSANTNTASPRVHTAPAGARTPSPLAKALHAVKSAKAGDVVIAAMWVAFAGYGLAATVNVLLTY